MGLVGINLGNGSCRLIQGIDSCLLIEAMERSDHELNPNEFPVKKPGKIPDKFKYFSKHIVNCASQIMHILGCKFSDPELQSELGFLPFVVIKGPDGCPLINGGYGREARTFTPIEILAMLISSLLIEIYPPESFEDHLHDNSYCIGIPTYFTDKQRQDVLEAAQFAGLTSPILLDEITAMALVYVRNSSLMYLEHTVVFVDIGHTNMQVCFAEVDRGQINIQYKSYLRSLGGRDFDIMLFKHFASEIRNEYNIDMYESAIDCLSLLDACEGMKKNLSTYDDTSFCIKFSNGGYIEGSIERKVFENISTPILKRFKAALQKALHDYGLNTKKLFSVQAVGNGCSMPAIINIVREVFGREPKKMTRSDEYVPMGCVICLQGLYPLPLDLTTGVVNLESVSSKLPFEGEKEEGPEKWLWRWAMNKQGHSLISIHAAVENFWDSEHQRSKSNNDIREVDELKEETPENLYVGCFAEFSYSELQDATNNFHQSFKLGEGGFGIVYKGILHKTTVAIKMLKVESSQGTKEFNMEVEILSKVRHPNLVTLIGACKETRALIYEYLPNGSLEDRLNCKGNTPPLSWKNRVRIAIEICSALTFLHCSKPHGIVHGDLKPENILLDSNNVSKISDFGLSRKLNWTDSASIPYHETECPKGTLLYMDPEYFQTCTMTPQYDIYALGIILLQLVTCKDPRGIRNEVEKAQENGNLKNLIDSSAGAWPIKEAMKMVSLGLRCSHPIRKHRPDLSTVWSEIKSMLDVGSAWKPSLLARLLSRRH